MIRYSLKHARLVIPFWMCVCGMQVGSQLCSKDWRNRMDALRALSALGPALPEVPNAALEGLLQALVGRLSDGNAKVNQKALEVSLGDARPCLRPVREGATVAVAQSAMHRPLGE